MVGIGRDALEAPAGELEPRREVGGKPASDLPDPFLSTLMEIGSPCRV
jgi:hypothetical protein